MADVSDLADAPDEPPDEPPPSWAELLAGKIWRAPDGTRWCYVASMGTWAGWRDAEDVWTMEPLEFHRAYPTCPRPAWMIRFDLPGE